MKARKPCRWAGCLSPRSPGRGCSYCKEHKIEARKLKRKRDRSKWRKRARTSSKPIEVLQVEGDPGHELALRMLAGKA